MTSALALEQQVSTNVLGSLFYFAPALDPELAYVPCPRAAGQMHCGIRLGSSEIGYAFFHRCAFRWWVQQLPPGRDARQITEGEFLAASAHDFGNLLQGNYADAALRITAYAGSIW